MDNDNNLLIMYSTGSHHSLILNLHVDKLKGNIILYEVMEESERSVTWTQRHILMFPVGRIADMESFLQYFGHLQVVDCKLSWTSSQQLRLEFDYISGTSAGGWLTKRFYFCLVFKLFGINVKLEMNMSRLSQFQS